MCASIYFLAELALWASKRDALVNKRRSGYTPRIIIFHDFYRQIGSRSFLSVRYARVFPEKPSFQLCSSETSRLEFARSAGHIYREMLIINLRLIVRREMAGYTAGKGSEGKSFSANLRGETFIFLPCSCITATIDQINWTPAAALWELIRVADLNNFFSVRICYIDTRYTFGVIVSLRASDVYVLQGLICRKEMLHEKIFYIYNV